MGDSNRTKVQICAANGTLNWNEVEDVNNGWLKHLNDNNYLGHNNWRQPTTTQADVSCESQQVAGGFPNQGFGYNCRGSELGHLFNTTLANPNHAGDTSTGGVGGTGCAAGGFAPQYCFQNVGPFANAQSFAYWSGSSYAPNPIFAWYFSTFNGFQNLGDKGFNNLYVWPVRSGQSVVASAQPIPTLSVWGLAIMILLLGFVVRRKV
ncbi:MAG: hypothetical protein QM500_06810 [Methylococcales bacterium]